MTAARRPKSSIWVFPTYKFGQGPKFNKDPPGGLLIQVVLMVLEVILVFLGVVLVVLEVVLV